MSGSQGETVFAVEAVRFAYAGQPLCLDVVSFDVRRGERHAKRAARNARPDAIWAMASCGLRVPV